MSASVLFFRSRQCANVYKTYNSLIAEYFSFSFNIVFLCKLRLNTIPKSTLRTSKTNVLFICAMHMAHGSYAYLYVRLVIIARQCIQGIILPLDRHFFIQLIMSRGSEIFDFFLSFACILQLEMMITIRYGHNIFFNSKRQFFALCFANERQVVIKFFPWCQLIC